MFTLGMVTMVVDDYDRALDYFVGVLGFTLVEDTALAPDKRWVVVSPAADSPGARLLLAQARDDDQKAAIGRSTGGRVAFFLYTSSFDETYENFLAAGVDFTEQPRHESWGRVVVFRDLYGNGWDLIEVASSN